MHVPAHVLTLRYKFQDDVDDDVDEDDEFDEFDEDDEQEETWQVSQRTAFR